MTEFKTLDTTSFAQITETFNEAFSDYSVPISFKEKQLIDKFASQGGRLDISVGAFENERLVAFILHFEDDKNGVKYVYNGGTGVIPSYRGKRLTSKMYDFILPILKAQNINRLILEVFTDNLSASKIYQSQGFEIKREVACFSGELKQTEATILDKAIQILPLTTLDWSNATSLWDFSPTWQNSISTLKRLHNDLLIFGAKNDQELIGYIVFNPKLKRIHQLAVSKDYRNKGIGSTLLNRVLKEEKERISLINVDCSAENIRNFLEKRGLSNFVNQFEMEMKLT